MSRPSRAPALDLLVGFAALLTYARGVRGGLLATWDDGRFLIENPDVHSYSLEGLRSIWTQVHFQAYHPLHLLSYWLDVPLSGPNGPVQHAVNLGLWIVGLLLLRRVLSGLGLAAWAATLGALFYGLHPIQVEAVTWATGRKEILALIFACLMILAHLRSERPWDRYAWLARGAYLLAALSKTTTLPLPALLLLVDLRLRDIPWRRALLAQLPSLLLGLGLGAIVVGIWSEHEMIRPDTPAGGILAPATLTHYLGTALFPHRLSPVYPIDREGAFALWHLIGPLLCGLGLWWGYRARSSRVSFTILAFLVLLLPVLNFVPIYFQTQDRYLSLPLLALAFGFGALVEAAGRRLQVRHVQLVAGLLLVAYAGRNVLYQGAWASDDALWEHATRTHPDAFYAWLKRGEHLRDRGRYDEAIEAYVRAVRAEPSLKLGHAALFVAQTLRDEARQALEPQAFSLGERYYRVMGDVPGLRLLAGEMVEWGYRDASLVPLERSIELEPLSDERLEDAALRQHAQGRDWLARYYMSRMSRVPFNRGLRGLIDPTWEPDAPAATSPGSGAPASP